MVKSSSFPHHMISAYLYRSWYCYLGRRRQRLRDTESWVVDTCKILTIGKEMTTKSDNCILKKQDFNVKYMQPIFQVTRGYWQRGVNGLPNTAQSSERLASLQHVSVPVLIKGSWSQYDLWCLNINIVPGWNLLAFHAECAYRFSSLRER